MLGVRPTFHARQPARPIASGGLRLSRAHKQLAFFLGALALLTLVGFTSSLAPDGRSLGSLVSSLTAREGDRRSDRITLVVVWAGLAAPKYLNLFLRSVEANSAVVDLVFVAKQEGGRCVNFGPALGSNINFVCLDNREYWTLHRDYLCNRWQCSPNESTMVLEELIARGVEDYIHSHFRLLRGPVFKRFFRDDSTRWWGWCDTDVVLGHYGRLIPWVEMREFDVVQPTHSTNAKDILLYMRGHMTFFNNRQSTLDKLHSFPAFRSVNSWLTGKKPTSAMEEEDFSTHIFSHAHHITFFAWDAMLTGHFQTLSLSPHLTSFTSPLAFNPAHGLPQPSTGGLFSPTPTTEGEVTLVLGQTTEPVWMDLAKVVSFTSLVPGNDAVRRFYWRDEGGQVWERCEPWTWYSMIPNGQEGPIREGLYAHHQVVKHEKWFKSLPDEPLGTGRMLLTAGWDSAEVLRSLDGEKYERMWRSEKRDLA